METSQNTSKSWRLSTGWAASARQAIRYRRRSLPFRLLAQISSKYLRAWYNEGFFDFSMNGEAFALQTFAEWLGDVPVTIWDVGANDGGWATEAAQMVPSATIHSFEIVPPTADDFARNLGDNPRHKLHRFGLSDKPGQVEVSFNTAHRCASAINYSYADELGNQIEMVTCAVETADGVVAAGTPAPVLLKIDTEGHDPAVLRGATQLLNGSNAPVMIQFEYGGTWVPSGETLQACHRLLTNAGYKVGRLYPNYVEFKDYDYEDEHFRMGNMIAVRDERLARMLARS